MHGVDNAMAEMNYKRLAGHGPKLRRCDRQAPLVERYFTHVEACPGLGRTGSRTSGGSFRRAIAVFDMPVSHDLLAFSPHSSYVWT